MTRPLSEECKVALLHSDPALWGRTLRKAIAELDRLAADNDRLQRMIGRWTGESTVTLVDGAGEQYECEVQDRSHSECSLLVKCTELDRLAAENERYKAALEWFAQLDHSSWCAPRGMPQADGTVACDPKCVRSVARAALTPPEDKAP